MKRFSRAKLTLLSTALMIGTALPAAAFDLSNMSEAEREAFRNEVRAYLLENPEVIMEAVSVLEERQAAQAAMDDLALVRVNAEALFNDGYSHVAGNPDGDVTIVEFVDYRCGYCRKAYDEVTELLEKDKGIRLILKEYPILGEDSLNSSRFAISAQLLFGEDAYAKLHPALITLRGAASIGNLIALADDLGLDGKAIAKGMTADRVDEILGENHALARRLQITGTPAFVMGEQLARGYMPLAQMEAFVSDIRSAQ
ncbi:DsbA family protein [Aliiroseovarius crassostreae]|uniref:DsbA family protein n=1 Tax=Aliiroseovarius crassostreae TaxID=154981 RepID=UPI002203B6C5|nr:DsbA family protein [Aliiroseovarius crassostreae]UWQ02762.1 DsbA family protein [Aliiroseovarius crassostreae]